ncbi:hypothetical protein ACE6H2_025533 [Prunus campanulata]
MWFQLVCGVLGHGPETKQCVTFTWINFSSPAHAVQVLASHNLIHYLSWSCNNAMPVTDTGIKIQTGQFFRPKLVDALKGLPCKQLELVSGSNFCLVHGERHDEFQPRAIQTFKRNGIHVVRVSAGDENRCGTTEQGQPLVLQNLCVLKSGRLLFWLTLIQYMVVVGWGLVALDFQIGEYLIKF